MSIWRRFLRAKRSVTERAGEPFKGDALSLPTVKADPSKVTDAVKADLRLAVAGLEDLPESAKEQVYQIALRASVSLDLFEMTEALKGLGLSKPHSIELSHWLPKRARALITRDERIALGMTEAVWVYSGAPCAVPGDDGSKVRDEAHRLANGKKFNVAEGLSVHGDQTWPGYEKGCKCSSKSVLPF